MNKLIFGMTFLNIVQGYGSGWTHSKHTDYPIDVMGKDNSGRDWFCCPCDSMTVKRIWGVGTQGVNTVWLQSDSPVDLADGTVDYITILFTHPDDDDLSKLRQGQQFRRGEKMFREGNDGSKLGLSIGNHLHISVSKSKLVGLGWKQNSKGAYDIITNPIKPEKAFYLANNCKIISTMRIKFLAESQAPDDDTLHIGDKILIKSGAVYSGSSAGKRVPDIYTMKLYTVMECNEVNVRVRELNSWVPKKYIIKS